MLSTSNAIPILILLVALVVALLILLISGKRARSKIERTARLNQGRSEVLRDTLGRVGHGSALASFLNSEAGKELLRIMDPAPSEEISRERMLRVMFVGIVIASFGIGLIVPVFIRRIPEFASVIAFIGMGIVLASYLSLRMQNESQGHASETMGRRPDWHDPDRIDDHDDLDREEERTSTSGAQESSDRPHGLG